MSSTEILDCPEKTIKPDDGGTSFQVLLLVRVPTRNHMVQRAKPIPISVNSTITTTVRDLYKQAVYWMKQEVENLDGKLVCLRIAGREGELIYSNIPRQDKPENRLKKFLGEVGIREQSLIHVTLMERQSTTFSWLDKDKQHPSNFVAFVPEGERLPEGWERVWPAFQLLSPDDDLVLIENWQCTGEVIAKSEELQDPGACAAACRAAERQLAENETTFSSQYCCRFRSYEDDTECVLTKNGRWERAAPFPNDTAKWYAAEFEATNVVRLLERLDWFCREKLQDPGIVYTLADMVQNLIPLETGYNLIVRQDPVRRSSTHRLQLFLKMPLKVETIIPVEVDANATVGDLVVQIKIRKLEELLQSTKGLVPQKESEWWQELRQILTRTMSEWPQNQKLVLTFAGRELDIDSERMTALADVGIGSESRIDVALVDCSVTPDTDALDDASMHRTIHRTVNSDASDDTSSSSSNSSSSTPSS